VKHKNKFILTDNGEAHHALSNAKPFARYEEISKDEAIKKLADYIKAIVEKYNYTKIDVENYMLDSDAFHDKLLYCEKHKVFYSEYEGCYECHVEYRRQW